VTRIGTVLSIGDPVMAELAAQALDLVWIDLEHGALSARDAQVLALAVQSTGAQACVRVPSGRFDALPAILDAGVDGIVVPSVESAEEARAVVRRLSYPPAGDRGFGPRRAGGYGRATGGAPRPDCIVQIESPAGLEHVAEIAAVAGVDCLVLGCADLAVSLGIERRLDTPELAQAAEAVADAAERYGVGFGLAGTGPARQVAALAAGRADFVLVSADVRLYAAGVDAQAGALRAALEAVRAPA
jgi:2-keto-3-deoxy-L-rhamnonate aldolase RhmA